VFAPTAPTAAVYEACVLPLLVRALEGYNVTIFAYVPCGGTISNLRMNSPHHVLILPFVRLQVRADGQREDAHDDGGL